MLQLVIRRAQSAQCRVDWIGRLQNEVYFRVGTSRFIIWLSGRDVEETSAFEFYYHPVRAPEDRGGFAAKWPVNISDPVNHAVFFSQSESFPGMGHG